MALQLDMSGHAALTGPAPKAYGVIDRTEAVRRGETSREDGVTRRQTVEVSVTVTIAWYSSRDWRDAGGRAFARPTHTLELEVAEVEKLAMQDELLVPMLYEAVRAKYYPDAESV